jgi:opacity protein-like surface antigen
MNKKVMMFVSALGVVSSAQAAFAQSVDQNERGVYVALQGGVAKVNDVDVDYFDQAGTFGGTGGQDIAEFKADLKNAFNVKGAVGYDFGLIRADVEVAYSRNKVKGLTVEGINGTPVTLTAADRTDVCDYLEVDTCGGSGNTFQVDGGKLRQLSALGNIWVDVPTGSVVTPYIGGLARASHSTFRLLPRSPWTIATARQRVRPSRTMTSRMLVFASARFIRTHSPLVRASVFDGKAGQLERSVSKRMSSG